MKLLDFIANNSNWRDLLQEKPYYLTISEDEDYILLKYSQIDSDFNSELVRECRGVILYKPTLEVVCRPFDKFGNYGEGYCPAIDWNSIRVQSKIDGCCDANTKIITKSGEKTIKEIVENYKDVEVLTFNFEKNQSEFNKVEAASEKKNNDDWYEIELENSQKIKLTGNHRVWVENLNCYRQVKDLKGDEEVKFI